MIDIDRNRRYARLMSMAKKPVDESDVIWFWYSSFRFETYLYAIRYIQHQALIAPKPVANLHLHNELELA